MFKEDSNGTSVGVGKDFAESFAVRFATVSCSASITSCNWALSCTTSYKLGFVLLGDTKINLGRPLDRKGRFGVRGKERLRQVAAQWIQ
jgi:hypothetical protein